ncbi:LysR family transcriptional regulator [Pseudomonas sp. R2.Fl]|nr:LysR family transcriptional regulator [Pseudomonas sp. R2.Fl]
MEKLPPLSSLLAFEAVYVTGSVTAAAERLGRTHSAVSKQLHQLQDHAGVTLFTRQGTGLVLTPAARTYAKMVAAAFEEMRGGWRGLTGQGDRQSVTIGVSATFARVWAIPTVSRFNQDHPDIDVLIRLAGPSQSRELEAPPDLVMSWDRLLSPGSDDRFTVSLGDVEMGPVVAPGHRHDLRDGVLSCATRIDRLAAEVVWDNWQALTGIRLAYDRILTYDHSYLAFEAARMAMGMVMAPRFLIEEELASGALVAPAGFLTFKEGFYVRPYGADGRMTRSARIFLDWLARNARLDGKPRP